MRNSSFIIVCLYFLIVGCNSKKTEWSPYNAQLLFMSGRNGNAELYVTTGTDTQWVNLTNNSAGDNWGVWSPDGQKIVFQSKRGGNLDIWTMNADGSNPVQLTNNAAHDYLPECTPDGSKISFTSWRTEIENEEPSPHIYIMNSDGTNQHRLVSESLNTSSGASWHPGGESFVFSRKVAKKGADIFIADRSGKIVQQLTADTLYNGAAIYSPDGGQIAYYADNGESSDIFVMRADGTEKRKLTNGGQNWYPRWSPDGKWIVFTVAVPGTEQKDLDIYALPVVHPDQIIKLVERSGRDQEGVWRK